jgi:Fe-S cluster biogenesis protein NfuA
MANIQDISARVEKVLDQLRPYLHEDGGDVKLVEVSDAMVAKIELTGNCTSCSMNSMTFKNGIEESIFRSVPEIKKVEALNFTLHKTKL